jgi:hypothetical protein
MRPAVLVTVAAALALAVACGGPDTPPARGVIENDLDGWSFRRYQSVLDVEVWVPDNRAVAHTASYARKEAEKRGQLSEQDVVSAFVTRYQTDTGIERALVKFVRRLAQESGYRVEEREIGDVRLVAVSGAGETWALWPARRHVVKIGGPGRRDIPESVIEAYGERYPSELKTGALDAPLPAGPDPALSKPAKEEPFDPEHPKPEWDKGKKDPGKQ